MIVDCLCSPSLPAVHRCAKRTVDVRLVPLSQYRTGLTLYMGMP